LGTRFVHPMWQIKKQHDKEEAKIHSQAVLAGIP
jgi:hypothetical protein